ncbi:MAG: hypothetical protein C4527_19935 [Candidatus Omnitrophota bacterium]|jgi:predicted esterase|nr:MAG: hypothetical protein C4527_19935 [Candidatus Omnitrophota bacterium]
MNTNRLISRSALAVMLVMVFSLIWIPIGYAAVTAERILPRSYYLPGQQRMAINIQITCEAESVVIRETIPPGWTIYSVGQAGLVHERTITWEIPSYSGSLQIRYIVNAPAIADSDAVFSGMVNEVEIGGDKLMQFHRPTPGKQVPLNPGEYYQYWLYLPSDYSDQEGQWPLILFLHGACIVGSDLDLVLNHYDDSSLAILKNPNNAESFPALFQCIVVSPQSTTARWNKQDLKGFLMELQSTYSIDPDRVYLIGHGIGGADGWDFANENPESVAAFISIIAAIKPAGTENLADIPFWVFQEEANTTVTITEIESMLDQVRAHGGNVKCTTYPPEIEDILAPTFNNPEIYAWLLQQNKRSSASGLTYWEMY